MYSQWRTVDGNSSDGRPAPRASHETNAADQGCSSPWPSTIGERVTAYQYMSTRESIAGWASCVAFPSKAMRAVPFASCTTTPRPKSSHSCRARNTIRSRMLGTRKLGVTAGLGVSGGGPGGRVAQPAASSAVRTRGASRMRWLSRSRSAFSPPIGVRCRAAAASLTALAVAPVWA